MFKKFKKIIMAIQVTVLLLFIVGFFPFHFLIDGINHLRPFLLALLGCSLAFSVKSYGLRKSLFVLSLGLLLNMHILPSLFSFPDKSDKETITILHLNLLVSNSNYDAVKNLIREKAPDLISLQECNNQWYKELAPLLQNYHVTRYIEDSPFGICVASKIPVLNSSVENPPNNTPYIKLHLSYQGNPFHFYSVHPTPPFTQELFEKRNRFYQEFLKNEQGNKLLIAGDLNCTPWSPYYQRFTNKLNVKGTLPLTKATWSPSFVQPVLQLDHILISKAFTYKSCVVLPDVGSDHRPIFCEIHVTP